MDTQDRTNPQGTLAVTAEERKQSRAQAKAQTRAAILVAARRQFVERGYEATTIRDIAQAAGVAVGSVHAHFKDKEALLLVCFFAGISATVQRIWDELDPAAPLLEQLTRCGEMLYEGYAEHPALSRVMFMATLFSERPEVAGEDPLEPFLAGVVGLFRQALARGEITRLPGDGLVAAQCFFAVYLATLIGGLRGHFGVDPDPKRCAKQWAAMLRVLVRQQLEGLGATLEGTQGE